MNFRSTGCKHMHSHIQCTCPHRNDHNENCIWDTTACRNQDSLSLQNIPIHTVSRRNKTDDRKYRSNEMQTEHTHVCNRTQSNTRCICCIFHTENAMIADACSEIKTFTVSLQTSHRLQVGMARILILTNITKERIHFHHFLGQNRNLEFKYYNSPTDVF